MENMITEDYVSYKVALELKKNGFDERVISFYEPGDIQRPTLQMAMKWLRVKHNLSVEVYRTNRGYISGIIAIPRGNYIKFLDEDDDDLSSGEYKTWDDACEAAILYCLEYMI